MSMGDIAIPLHDDTQAAAAVAGGTQLIAEEQ